MSWTFSVWVRTLGGCTADCCACLPKYFLTSCLKKTVNDREQTANIPSPPPRFILPLSLKCLKVWRRDSWGYSTLKLVLQNSEQKKHNYLWDDCFASGKVIFAVARSSVLCISQESQTDRDSLWGPAMELIQRKKNLCIPLVVSGGFRPWTWLFILLT